MALDAQAQKALLGRVLRERWRLDALLGSGGMATVYAATHRNGGRGAIKLLHPEYAFETDVRTRLVREGYLVNKIKHDGIVRVLDDDLTEEGWPYLVMELLEGRTLKERWIAADRRLPLGEALRIAEAVLDILAAAHDEGVVHRDVKPDNVFLTDDDGVRLLDFGIARFKEAAMDMTQTGAMMGTPAFMAPEQALAHWDEVDGRSDVFSVGATLWAVLTGRMVHAAKTVPEALIAAATKRAQPFARLVPDAPPALAAILDRALAYEPASRFQSAAAMRDAIAVLRGQLATSNASSALGAPPAPEVAPPIVPSVTEVMARPTLERAEPGESDSPARDVRAVDPASRELPGDTAQPTAVPRRSEPPPRSSRWRTIAVAVGALAAGGVSVALFQGQTPTPPTTTSSGPTPATSVETPRSAATQPQDTATASTAEAEPTIRASAGVAPPVLPARSGATRPNGASSAAPASSAQPFDRAAALGAISAESTRAASVCGMTKLENSVRITVSYQESGEARAIRPAGANPAQATSQVWCLLNAMDRNRMKIAPFGGGVQNVTTAVLID